MKNVKYSLRTASIASQNVKERDYWLNKLSGDLQKATLPYTYNSKKSNLKEPGINSIKFQIASDIFSRLMRLSNNSDTRLYTILVTVVILLINKYTGSEDIIVGTSICKQDNDVDLINTVLALRIQLKDRITFKELLLQVRQTYVEATDNQDYPYQALLYNLNLPDSENDFPLFEVVVLLENIHERKYIQHTKPNIIFSFFREGEAIKGLLEYNTSLYEKSMVENIIRHYSHLLRTTLLNLDLQVSKLDVLPEEERSELIRDFNEAGMEYPGNKVIHQLFEEQVRRTADNIAVVCRGEEFTYSRLNEKVNRLARVLREKNVGSDVIVGMIMDPSFEMVVAILGILKAGGAYLPIDLDSPQERIKYMLADSNVNLVISHKGLVGNLEFKGKSIDIDSSEIYKKESSNLEIINDSEDLAYIIYTSGSTGKPKGVMTQHGNVIAYLNAFYQKIEITSATIMLQQASYTFDMFVEEVYSVLLRGGRIAIPDYFEIIDANLLSEFIAEHNINTVDCSPLLLNELNKLNNVGGVHTFISGGDTLKKEYVDNFLKKEKVYNSYGPTESTICVTFHECSIEDPPNIPIGKPLPNYKVYILDKNEKLFPPGVPGELCVSGTGVARGYLNRPGLTKEKFIENPFGPGERLYKTGDLARVRFGRNIEFLGRIDLQVKIRGYRIELGEIENQILNVGGIKEVVVVVKEDETDDRFLCAYIVSDVKVNILALKESLGKELPDYMIPTYFVQVDNIPLTENGKIDKRALPDVDMEPGEDFVAPGDEVESALAAIWSGVLAFDYDKIGINDNFFLLGGHSLRATILVSMIHKTLDVKIPFSVIFETPTIKGLADYIKSVKKDKYAAVEPVAKKDYYALSHGQKRVYVLQQMEEGNISYNGPEMVILEGNLEKEKLEDVFRKLIRRHESLRTSIELIDDEPFQKIHEEVDFVLEYFEASREKARKLVKSFVKPFDLGKAPLLRVRLIKVVETKHILMVDMHHIISDGTSQEIFINDFLNLYSGKELPPLRIQYKDYSEWQNSRNEAEKELERKQEEYWLDQFRDGVPVLNLPTDYERPEVRSFEGDKIRFTIPKKETEMLNTLALEEEATLFIVLLAILNIFLSRLSGQEDIVVGTPVAGRNHADLEPIIGMYVNTLALRNYPRGERTFKEFLREVKERTLQAFENQEYQFEDLVDNVIKGRSPNRTPMFDVLLALQNIDSWGGEIPGLKVILDHEYKFDHMISKFDMVFIVELVDNELSVELEHSTELFKSESIKMFNDYFKQIVSVVTKNADVRLEDIRVVSDVFDGKLNISKIDFGF
jgi:amino acid adenylation domain-containing protein